MRRYHQTDVNKSTQGSVTSGKGLRLPVRRTTGCHGKSIQPRTVSRIWKRHGIRCRSPLNSYHLSRILVITGCNGLDRLNQRLKTQVLFSDEFRFIVSNADGRARYVNNCIFERDRFGGGAVMVWGTITIFAHNGHFEWN